MRDPAVLATIDPALRPGGYLFATIHRAENREPAAMRAWAALLGAVAGPDRPVILALHPGTRAALDAASIELSPDVRVIEPQGYRTTLAPAAPRGRGADRFGRRPAGGSVARVPCLVLRGTTEWVEALAGSGGTMVVVGLDADRARAELERLAPRSSAAAAAEARAASLRLEPAGAVDAIVAALG